MKRADWRQALRGGRGMVAGVALTAGLLLALLAVQHQRHGWPFSLHHGGVQPDPTVAIAAGYRGDSQNRPPRATVELDRVPMAMADIQIEPARTQALARVIRAVATVVPDERLISHVHTRSAGWIEELFIAATGERVRAGQPLAAIFSQDLYASQSEYLSALAEVKSGPQSAVVSSARARLGVLGMSDAEITAIERTGEARKLVTVTAPRDGVVLRRSVSAGTAVDPSTELYTLADLSTVWVIAELPESDMRDVFPGMPVALDIGGSGSPTVEAAVDFIHPTVSERTRTTRVRMVVDNADGRLRPGMYGNARFHAPPRQALTVPRSAVVDTGLLQHVFVAVTDTRFEPRPVKLGVHLPDSIEILEGVTEGERIVSSGVFLLDSESRLRSVGGAISGHGHSATTPEAETPPDESRDHSGHRP